MGSNIGGDSFTRNTAQVPSDQLTGSWVTNDYSLSLSDAGDNIFRMSIGIKAGNNKSGRIKRVEDGTWSLMEPMMSTMMLPSPEIQEKERQVSALFEKLTSITRDGDSLVVTFVSGEKHTFGPTPRPPPATKDKIHWMRS